MRQEKFIRVLSQLGKVTIPHELRKKLGAQPGTGYQFSLSEDGTLTLRFEQSRNEMASGK